MALIPNNEAHSFQIEAGTVGRKKGHAFERMLTEKINIVDASNIGIRQLSHIETGNPAVLLLGYIQQSYRIEIIKAKAYWLGGLATARSGDSLCDTGGKVVNKSKTDILVEASTSTNSYRVGISVKTCNNKTPTNDQMFFTTAKAFCQLLINNGIPCSEKAIMGMSMFCGDVGYRPIDTFTKELLSARLSDPSRYYWEELPNEIQSEWEHIFYNYQDEITLILFQKAYKDDPFPPEILLHQTVKYDSFERCRIALFTMEEIVELSRKHSRYILSPYVIRKGRYKAENSIHYAPRFGFIQFQRGGQKQHPTQLQFNLKAGYFNHLLSE